MVTKQYSFLPTRIGIMPLDGGFTAEFEALPCYYDNTYTIGMRVFGVGNREVWRQYVTMEDAATSRSVTEDRARYLLHKAWEAQHRNFRVHGVDAAYEHCLTNQPRRKIML